MRTPCPTRDCYATRKNMNLEADTREVWEWIVSTLVFLGLWIFFVWYSDLNVFRKTHLASTSGRQMSQQANIFKLKIKTSDLLNGFWIAKILRIYSMVDEWNMSKDCWLTDWYWQGKTKMLVEKLALVPLRLPHILHWLAWVPARIFALISTHWFRCELIRYSQFQDRLHCFEYSHHFLYVPAHTTHHTSSFLMLLHTATVIFEGWVANSAQEHVCILFLLHFNTDTITVNCFQFCVICVGTSPYLGSTVTGYWEECMYIRGKEHRLVKAP
jgi:hypothetical protein